MVNGQGQEKHHHIKELNESFGSWILIAELKNKTPPGIINKSYPFNYAPVSPHRPEALQTMSSAPPEV